MRSSFYSEEELKELGLGSLGSNVKISRHASIYSPGSIHLGNNVRIDDFCVLSGGARIEIGNYVHVAAQSLIFGQGEVVMEDFTCISSRVAIYSISDDFSGETLTNSTIPVEFLTRRKIAPVILRRHALIGTMGTLLPGVVVGVGAATAAHTLVTRDLDEWTIYCGVPAKPLRPRSRELLNQEKVLLGQAL